MKLKTIGSALNTDVKMGSNVTKIKTAQNINVTV